MNKKTRESLEEEEFELGWYQKQNKNRNSAGRHKLHTGFKSGKIWIDREEGSMVT